MLKFTPNFEDMDNQEIKYKGVDNQEIKYKGILYKLWTDPVLSKLLSVGILFLIGLIYTFCATVFRNISFLQTFLDTINYPIAIYKIFIALIAFILLFATYIKIRKSKKNIIGNFDSEQTVGNFTFRELYNALLTQKVQIPQSLSATGALEKGDLLSLYILFHRKFNLGVDWNHPGDQGNFMYNTLGPALMAYGLTERTPCRNKKDVLEEDIIQTSKDGYYFFALLERLRINNRLQSA